jgi:hypothetical protein
MRIERNTFANLETLVFPSDRDKFYAFVAYCRGGGTPHADLAHRGGPYDLVVGPVTMAGQTMIVGGGGDQVSFHTVAATAAISQVAVHAIGNPELDVSP